jgi:hypothetical protein
VPDWFLEGPADPRHLEELSRLQEGENGQLEVETQLVEVNCITFVVIE